MLWNISEPWSTGRLERGRRVNTFCDSMIDNRTPLLFHELDKSLFREQEALNALIKAP
jgi:hypothetical protein